MKTGERHIYRFNEVEVDLSRSCISLSGREIHLRRKAFQVLVHLLHRREQLVTKSELFEAVWNETSVTEDALVQCVKEIRRAIGDDPHKPRFIRTVPKSGYRFIAEVEEIGLPAEAKISAASLLNGRPSISRASLYTGMTIVMLLVIGVFLSRQPAINRAMTRTPVSGNAKAIVFRPFENRSASAEFDWLREGLPDMLGAGFAGQEDLVVISDDSRRLLNSEGNASTPLISDLISRRERAGIIITGDFALIGERLRVDVRISDANGQLLASESMIMQKAEQILSDVDLLSLKILKHLGGSREKKQELASVMTDDLEAYRYYSLAVDKAHRLENKDAIELLEKAIELDPEFAMAYARIGYAYALAWGKLEKGKPYLEKAFQLSPRLTEKDRMNIAAWYALANYDFESSISSFRQIIERFPFETEAYWRLAKLLAGESRTEEAVEVLRKGITVDPQSKDLYNTLGGLLSTLGRHQEAIAAHERYVFLAPEEPNAYDSLGLSYQWAGDHEKAIQNYERSLELNPDFEIALIHLANSRIRQGQYRAAAKSFHRYIQIAPSDGEKVRGYASLAFLHMRKGELSLAEGFAAKAASINPEHIWESYEIAVARGQRSRIKALERRILRNTTWADRGSRGTRRLALYNRGMIAFNNGRVEQAIEDLREAIGQAPIVWNYDTYEDCLGLVYLKSERYQEAVVEFQRVLATSPNYPLAHFYLAEAYRSLGHNDEARENYGTFLDLWTDADADLKELRIAKAFVNS